MKRWWHTHIMILSVSQPQSWCSYRLLAEATSVSDWINSIQSMFQAHMVKLNDSGPTWHDEDQEPLIKSVRNATSVSLNTGSSRIEVQSHRVKRLRNVDRTRKFSQSPENPSKELIAATQWSRPNWHLNPWTGLSALCQSLARVQ